MRPVERINIALATTQFCPARRLDRARNFQRELIKLLLAWVEGNTTLAHEAPKIAIRRYIVEPMIVYTDMGDVSRHQLNGFAPAEFKKPLLSCSVKLEQRRTELKTLRPFGPTASGILAFNRKYRGAL